MGALDSYLDDPGVSRLLSDCYGDRSRAEISRRFSTALERLEGLVRPDRLQPARFVSTPGRSELGGNHTDHNNGTVVAASIEVDALAAVAPRDDGRIELRSKGFDRLFSVDLEHLEATAEEGGTQALLRGVTARCKELGYRIGGFSAYLDSHVLPGSGMSSSAAVEVLLGTIISSLYNDDAISAVELAKIGRYAENVYMRKPCGLMDQIACAHGGVVAIDFGDPDDPAVTGIKLDLHEHGYELAIVDTGGSHADLTDEYAAVPREMARVAALFGQGELRGISEEQLLQAAPRIRREAGDRALLRALHFVEESPRAGEEAEALRRGDFERFLELVRRSGSSSWRFLQNCVTPGDPEDQPLALGIAVAERLLGNAGAARVHGGGFAGTLQAFVPREAVAIFTEGMESLFGEDCVTTTGIRSAGTVAFPPL